MKTISLLVILVIVVALLLLILSHHLLLVIIVIVQIAVVIFVIDLGLMLPLTSNVPISCPWPLAYPSTWPRFCYE
jgi:hypothetical protein